MSTALVTGATGFLGRHLCRRLVADGWDVTATCRPSSDRSVLADVDLEWAVADVRDADAVREAVDGRAYVFHLAGPGLLEASRETVRRVNVGGTEAVLEACRDASVERVVFTSTAGTRYRADGPATETDVADPVGAYQSSKTRAEALVDEYADAGRWAVTVHPTSVFGPGDEQFTARLLSLVADAKRFAYLPGGVSIVGVGDVVDGIVRAATEGRPGEHYLLGGENRTYDAILRVLAHVMDGTVPTVRIPATAIHVAGPLVGTVNRAFGTRLFPIDTGVARLSTRERFYDSSKARRELGYSPRPLRAHAHEAIEWYLDRA